MRVRVLAAIAIFCTLIAPGCRRPRADDAERATATGYAADVILAGGARGAERYLARLRCADGVAPWFEYAEEHARGADGHTIHRFGMLCGRGAEERAVLFDLSHPGDEEQRPLPGTTIVPADVDEDDLRRAARPGVPCPPLNAVKDSTGRSVFHDFHLRTPARLLAETPVDTSWRSFARVVHFMIDSMGRPEEASVKVLDPAGGTLTPAQREAVAGLRFTQPEAHPGCHVREYRQLAM